MAEKLSGIASDIPFVIDRYARNTLEELRESNIFAGLNVPHGQGEPVVVIPGLHESDKELMYIMRFLANLGYIPESSGIGYNFGYPSQTLKAKEKVQALKNMHGQVSIVGHSWGGFMAAQIAQDGESVNKVITLGAPFLNGIQPATNTMIESIYSPSDGIVSEVTSVLHGANTKNFRVESPNHFELLCHVDTFREIAFALAS